MSARRMSLIAVLVLACACQRSPAPQTGSTTLPADTATQAADSPDVAAGVLRAYYRAIDERRYGDAYHLWASGGAASGKSLSAFSDGFGKTASVAVSVGAPGAMEGAAGSRYIEIPVQIAAVMSDSTHQSYTGSYTLRRSTVDGATADQHAWRIYAARIRRDVPPTKD